MMNLAAPRGTTDIFPPQSVRWQELESRIHDLARRFGYEEIRTPMFEATELFVRGVGEITDIVEKEMYAFTDKGGRHMTLRPEWTAPVVRALLQHNLLAAGVRRLYYLGPIFRYERPQAGRFRQSHQFGVECFGFEDALADVEIVQLAWELVAEYKVNGATLEINSLGDAACRSRYKQALLEHFQPHRAQLSADSARRLERNPLRVLDSKAPSDQPFVQGAPAFVDFLCDACRTHFEKVKSGLSAIGMPYRVNPHIVRGLDYYTRTVFEIVSHSLGAQSTVCGGGRYDNLVASLGGPPTPAAGFALGLERFLMISDAGPQSRGAQRSGITLIGLGRQARDALFPLLAQLRRTLHVPVFMDYDDRKLLAHLKAADRQNARHALIMGTQEQAAGEFIVRDLVTREDRRLPFSSVADATAALVEIGIDGRT